MKTIKRFAQLVALTVLFSCSSESVKEKINKAGDVAGQVGGEFAEGIAQGVEKAFNAKVEVSEALKEKGIEAGKTTVSGDSGGTDNLLTIYVIFNRDFKGELMARAFDDDNKEMGRARQSVEAKALDARYLEFRFDRRTNIDSNNRLVLE